MLKRNISLDKQTLKHIIRLNGKYNKFYAKTMTKI